MDLSKSHARYIRRAAVIRSKTAQPGAISRKTGLGFPFYCRVRIKSLQGSMLLSAVSETLTSDEGLAGFGTAAVGLVCRPCGRERIETSKVPTKVRMRTSGRDVKAPTQDGETKQ